MDRHSACGSLAESFFHCLPEMRVLDAAPGKKHDAVGAVPSCGSDCLGPPSIFWLVVAVVTFWRFARRWAKRGIFKSLSTTSSSDAASDPI